MLTLSIICGQSHQYFFTYNSTSYENIDKYVNAIITIIIKAPFIGALNYILHNFHLQELGSNFKL